MKVIEHLEKAGQPLVSFEIIPPQRGSDLTRLLEVVEEILIYHPPFIDITSHSAEIIEESTATGVRKKLVRKRPGTLGICALIQHKYKVDAVPHLLCRGFTRQETEDFLIELQYIGIENVLAIRGDDRGYQKELNYGRTQNRYAEDLVKQIVRMNNGEFLEETLIEAKSSNFCVGVAGYPEKHFEAPDFESDIKCLAEKIGAGAEYIVTQMFFDNQYYFDFVKACRNEGIKIPIIPGLKIITAESSLTVLPRKFHVTIPNELRSEISSAKPEHILDIGISWTLRQVEELFTNDVPAVHFFIMQNSKPVKMLMKKLKIK